MSRTRRVRARALLALTAVALSLPTAAGGLAADPLIPAQGALLGAHVEDDQGGVSQAALTTFEQRIGRRVDIDHYYRPWRVSWPDGREQWDFDNGRIPMVSWGKTDLAQISSGALDGVIRERAQRIAALGKPLFLRWFWEMDGKHNGEGGEFSVTGPDYIAAWKHIRAIFDQERAGNAVFVWCPNAWGFEIGKGPEYYPGDDQVDWICADGYNWFPNNPGSRDRTFQDVFSKWYEWASQRPKPLMIGEYGALEHEPGAKGRWIEGAMTAMKTVMPKVKAAVYFNHRGLAHEATGIDWRIETSPAATTAFSAFANDLYFNARAVPPGSQPPTTTVPTLPVPSEEPPPAVPEVPWALLLPLTAAAVGVVALAARRRLPV